MSKILIADDGEERKASFKIMAAALANLDVIIVSTTPDTPNVFELKRLLGDLGDLGVFDNLRPLSYPTKRNKGKFPKRFPR